MSRERELLQKVRDTLRVIDEFETQIDDIVKEIEELLAQPEPFVYKDRELTGSLIVHDDMYKRGYAQAELDLKRKHLTGIEISQGFQTDDDATHPYSYWSGVDFAEKAHGIGVDDE